MRRDLVQPGINRIPTDRGNNPGLLGLRVVKSGARSLRRSGTSKANSPRPVNPVKAISSAGNRAGMGISGRLEVRMRLDQLLLENPEIAFGCGKQPWNTGLECNISS